MPGEGGLVCEIPCIGMRVMREEGWGDLPFHGHGGAEYDWDGEDDEEEVGDDVACAHGDELGVPLATLRSGVRYHLPIVGEGATFGESCDDDADEGEHQEPADEL